MCDAYMLYAFYIHSKTRMLEVRIEGGEGIKNLWKHEIANKFSFSESSKKADL